MTQAEMVAEAFHQAMKAAGNDSKFVVNEGGIHGYLMFERALQDQTLAKSAAFLLRLSLAP